MIDNLTYSYEGNGNYNKLQSVTDGANDPASTLGDFKEVATGGTIDYLYDYNGNLRKDHNKQIDSIRYNHLNLPEHIHILGKGNIAYLYDAAGIKHRKVVTDSTVTPAKVTITDYIGGLVYEQDSLRFASHEEGRIRAVYATGQPVAYGYDYFLKDHLGNIRTVLTTGEQQTATYLASMETETAAKEAALFSNIDATRTSTPTGYPQDATTEQNSFVAKLNGENPDKKIGPSLVLKVMAGDTIQIGAKAFYKSGPAPQNKTTAPPEDMLNALISAFTGGQAPGEQGHGAGINAAANNTPFNNDFNNSYQRLKDKDNDATNPQRPKAYLNFVLFDEQFNLVEGNSGVKQVQATPDELQTLAQGKMVMEKSGFLYVYTSNESPQDVFFDNVVVMNAPGPVLEETHYYPFGLTMSGISTRAVGKLENRYKYNGIEKIGDLGLEDYDAKFRELDPQIGRWWQVDPKIENMEAWSPYASNYNNPIRFNDFLGDEPDDDGGLTFWKVAASVLGTLNGIVKSTGIFPGTRGELMPWTDEELAYFKAGEYVGRLGGPLLPLAGSRTGPTESLAPVPAGGGKAIPITQPAPLVAPLPEPQTTKEAKGTREPNNSSAPNSNKVEKSKTTETLGDGKFTKTTEVRPGKDPGQSRAEYVRYKNELGKVIKTFKDTYDRANKFIHRKPLRGGPEGRPQND